MARQVTYRLFVFLLALLAGCQEEPRETPFPRFSFEEPFDVDADVDEMQPVGHQAMGIGTTFVAAVPDDFEVWQWASRDGVALVQHLDERGIPDGFVVVEAFSEMWSHSPSLEHYRWLYTAAPDLTGVGSLGRMATRFATDQMQDGSWTWDVGQTQILEGLLVRSFGLGFAFDVEQDSFSGWKWIGRNKEGLTIRLARVEGMWRDRSDDVRDLESLMKSMSMDQPGLAGATAMLGNSTRDGDRKILPDRPASMVFGHLTHKDRIGVHVAFVGVDDAQIGSYFAALLASFRRGNRPVPARKSDVMGASQQLGFALRGGPAMLAGPWAETTGQSPGNSADLLEGVMGGATEEGLLPSEVQDILRGASGGDGYAPQEALDALNF